MRVSYSHKVFITLESFPRLEVTELAGAEYPLLVGPACQVFLPLRDDLVRVVRIAVWLGVGKESSSFGPPVVDAVERLAEVIQQDAVEEIFALVAVPVNQGRGPLAVSYLAGRVATEADALYPLNSRKESCDIVRHQTGIEPLIEVHTELPADYLLYL